MSLSLPSPTNCFIIYTLDSIPSPAARTIHLKCKSDHILDLFHHLSPVAFHLTQNKMHSPLHGWHGPMWPCPWLPYLSYSLLFSILGLFFQQMPAWFSSSFFKSSSNIALSAKSFLTSLLKHWGYFNSPSSHLVFLWSTWYVIYLWVYMFTIFLIIFPTAISLVLRIAPSTVYIWWMYE